MNSTQHFSGEGNVQNVAKVARERLPSPDTLQHSVLLCSAVMVFCVMMVSILGLLSQGQYTVNVGVWIDGVTVLMLMSSATLAWRRKNLLLEGVLLCASLPLNLISMLAMDDQASFLALQFLSITPIIWGLFTTVWLSGAYTIFLVAFIQWYMGPANNVEVIVNGSDDTFISALTLSLIAIACGVAATLPKHLGRSVYNALRTALRRENDYRSRSTSFAEMSSDWHLEVDSSGIIVHFFGKGQALGKHWRDVLVGWEVEQDSVNACVDARREVTRVKGKLKLDDDVYPVEFSGRPLFSASGKFQGYHAIAHDISIREEFERKLKEQATTDLLTGLENRHAFNGMIEALKASDIPTDVSVFYIDLDKFKQLNDRHGHGGGDSALVHLGARFKVLAEADADLRCFRIGGDEFCCVLARKAGLKEIEALARRLQTLVAEPVTYSGRTFDVTASIGVASTFQADAIDEVLEFADAAVYEAKSDGGDACVIPTQRIRDRLERRVSIHRDLMQAMTDGDIELHYQPIVRASDGDLVGVEALARWTHPKYGSISPCEFIEIAEASRNIITFGQFVLKRACEDMRDWLKRSGREIRLSVNVSPSELLSHNFVPTVARILNETEFPARLLELEITERGVLRNIEASYEVIVALRRLGATIALDDFGTGNSSLSRLEHLPVDRVKIDRSFFVRAEQSDRARQVLGILSGMSRVLDIKVIAEGVETNEQYRFAALAGFGEVQGYLFGRPAPISELDTEFAPRKLAGLSA